MDEDYDNDNAMDRAPLVKSAQHPFVTRDISFEFDKISLRRENIKHYGVTFIFGVQGAYPCNLS